MAAIAGRDGSVTFGGGAIVIVKNWTINDNADTEDVTGMAGSHTGWKSHALTLKGWTGTVEGFIDSTDAKFKGATPAIRSGASGAASLVAASYGTYSGSIIVTSVKVTTPVDGILGYSIEFTGSGALTYPT